MPKKLNHIRAWIEKICNNTDITLTDFHSDAEVEFSYQIKNNDEYAGLIYKKWDKSKIHVVYVYPVLDEELFTFYTFSEKVNQFCKKQGVVCVTQTDKEVKDSTGLVLNVPINQEDFDTMNFVHALASIETCISEINLYWQTLPSN